MVVHQEPLQTCEFFCRFYFLFRFIVLLLDDFVKWKPKIRGTGVSRASSRLRADRALNYFSVYFVSN